MFGHPKALYLLFTTEMWERFSYYSMRAILVLFLSDKAMSQGGISFGMGWEVSDAISLYGTFTMLVYLTPIIGGMLADNVFGQRKSILLGGALMSLGQFTLAIPHSWFPGMETTALYTGLALLVAGNGLFKPNISTMIGDLYEEGDHRRDGGFTIFYMGINVGAFLAGILVAEFYNAFGIKEMVETVVIVDGVEVVKNVEVIIRNWHAGFAAAGTGMLLSLVLQMTLAKKYLGNIGVEPNAKKEKRTQKTVNKAPLTKEEFDRIKVIFIMGVFTIIFWAGFEQAGGLLNIYADRFTDRFIGDWQVPTTYFQSLNPLFIVLFAPILASFWLRLGDKEPTSPTKFALGLVLLGLGFVFMIGATLVQGEDGGKASMLWLVGAYLFHTLGELCLSPIGLSMVTKLAPLRLASVLMGVWFGFTGLANGVAAQIGALVGTHGKEKVFEAVCVKDGVLPEGLGACVETAKEAMMVEKALGIFSGIAIATALSGLILYLFANKLIYWMHGAEGAPMHDQDRETVLREELEDAKGSVG